MPEGGSFPDKTARSICNTHRDVFWKCLTDNHESWDKCMEQRKSFEKACPKLWVKHFDRKREYEKHKAELEKSQPPPQPGC